MNCDYLLARIQGEFAEMPGMRLTFRQAQRLWALDATICRSVLDALLRSGFLIQSGEDVYARATGDPRISKADRSRSLTTASEARHPRRTALQR